MPTWPQTVECAISHPFVTHLRVCLYHRSSTTALLDGSDELVAVETLPVWALRPGIRAIALRDQQGSRLQLSKLLVHVELRTLDRLPPLEVRETYAAGERLPRQVAFDASSVAMSRDWGIFGFKRTGMFRSRTKYVSEGAGTVRLRVRRLGGGSGHAIMFYCTEDGTALAGLDYEPQSGHLHFREHEDEREIKILVIDDEIIERDKHFTVRLQYPENAKLHPINDRMRVVVVDDDLNWAEVVTRWTSYNIMEALCTTFALFGNEIWMRYASKSLDIYLSIIVLIVFIFSAEPPFLSSAPGGCDPTRAPAPRRGCGHGREPPGP